MDDMLSTEEQLKPEESVQEELLKEPKPPEFKAVKITNAFWLGRIAPSIRDFLKKVPLPGISYETLYTYIANTVAHGHNATAQNLRDGAEFWVVFEDKAPVAFAHWHLMPLPHLGVVSCDIIYSWNRKREPVNLLLDAFVTFGRDHRASLYTGEAANKAIFKVIKTATKKRKMSLIETERVRFFAF